jgi:hypothetical protein
MKFPNPNLLRFIRPTRLQLWCAHHGVLTGRWTYAETERIRRSAADRMRHLNQLFELDEATETLVTCNCDSNNPSRGPWHAIGCCRMYQPKKDDR